SRRPASYGADRRVSAGGFGNRRPQLRQWTRSPNVVALRILHPLFSHELEALMAAHELRDGLLAEPVRHLHDRPQYQLVGGASRRVPDELTVDLEVVERQVLQVVEGAKASAEVIECEAATDIRQRGYEPPGLVHIADRSRLGDLEDQLGGIDRRGLELF